MKPGSYLSIFCAFIFALVISNTALAQDVNDVASGIVDSVRFVPSAVAGFAYLSGIIMAMWGITKTIDHVSNPVQTPIRMPIVRFLVGGALFSLPIIIEAAANTISGGSTSTFSPQSEVMTSLGSFIGTVSTFLSLGQNFNALMLTIVDSIDLLPSLVAATGYMLGVLIAVSALYKVRDHIDDPMRVTLKEPVVRMITAGALFALPTIFEAMYNTITDDLGLGGNLSLFFSQFYFMYSTETQSLHCLTAIIPGLGGSLGDMLCNLMMNSFALPTFLTSLSYLLGLVMGVWGIIKLRDHALNPSQTSLWDGLSRFLAGGAFFALPAMVVVAKETMVPASIAGFSPLTGVTTNTTFNENVTCSATGNSLDQALSCLMEDILGPSHLLLNFFSFGAGLIFIMIGISRLTRSAQEGPKGPGGLGTITTFIIGGILLSATTILRTVSASLFSSPVTQTYANLSYTTGMSAAETDAVYNVISAVLKFMIIIGMVSFVRGLFIIREVAEGNQQASTMSAVTHIIGGALAVNLGPLLNAVQSTLGITTFGMSFGF